MKRLLILSFIASSIFSSVHAAGRGDLQLRAFVAPSISTSVKQLKLSDSQSLWILSSKSNIEHLSDSQRFEVEGLDQSAVESHIRKITSKERTVQYEILINRLKYTLSENRPIFLKIIAN